MKDIIKTVCVIIGTIIGAGFASGKEIYVFFNQYGIKGLLGIGVASILTGIVIYRVLTQIRNMEIENYHHYLEKIHMKPKIKEILNSIINIFLLISFYIMIAGFCAYFQQEFKLSPIMIGGIVCILCYLTFMGQIEGVTKINTILIPFLMIMIILIGIKSGGIRIRKTDRGNANPIKKSLVYSKFRICKL